MTIIGTPTRRNFIEEYLVPPKESGRYYSALTSCYNTSNSALTANYYYTTPIVIRQSESFDRIALEITAASAGGKVLRLGIYADNGALYPGSLVLDAETVAADPGGTPVLQTKTIAQTLAPGLFWLVGVSDGAPTVKFISSYSALGTAGTDGSTGQAPLASLYKARGAGDGALPATFPGGGTRGNTLLFVQLRSI